MQPDNGGDPKGSFLMKKWGPLPIAAYVVAGAALLGFFVLRNRGTSSGSSIQAAPTGINDPTTDPNASLITTLNDIETTLATMKPGSTGEAGTPVAPSPVNFLGWFGSNASRLQGVDKGTVWGAYIKENGFWVDYKNWEASRQKSQVSHLNPPTQADLYGEYIKEKGLGPLAQGGGEAPERILPVTFMRAPQSLATEITRRPSVS